MKMVSPQQLSSGQQALLNMLETCHQDEGAMESWHHLALSGQANDADTLNWNQAMNVPNAEGSSNRA